VLESHPAVEWVNYPGLKSHPATSKRRSICQRAGAIIGFGIRGGKERRKFIDNLKISRIWRM